MSDRLSEIEARLAHEDEPCCDHSGRDEHGCWDCRNTGHAHAPYVEGEAKGDLAALLSVVKAVQEIHRMRPAVAGLHGDICNVCSLPYPCPTAAALERLP
jgi:hypothetical protein